MRLLTFLFALLWCIASPAQRPDSVSGIIDSALRVMEHRSLAARRLDWSAIRAEIDRRTASARTPLEAAPALFWAFDALQDKHGWITIADSTHHNPYLYRERRTISAGTLEALRRGPRIYNGVVSGRYAYVSIHFFSGQTVAEMNAYAQRIQDSLAKNITRDTRGIIVDLRLNGGGNVFPMYQGIANVLGNGDFSEGIDAQGRSTGRFGIRDGAVMIHGNYNDSFALRLQRTCGDLSRLPVAVLIGPATGSAAEQLAIAFTSRPRSVLIGERTAGYVTANNGFELPGTGNSIVIAEGYSRNLAGVLFDEDVRPRQEVIGGDDFVDRSKDLKIKAAIGWLDSRQQTAARARW